MTEHNSRKRSAHPTGQAHPSTRFADQHFPERSDKCIRCRICSLKGTRRRTSYKCSSYNPQDPIYLCIDPCFRVWHTKNN